MIYNNTCRNQHEHHEWSEWTETEESGFVFFSKGARAGHFQPWTRTEASRSCKKCGQIERNPSRDDTSGIIPELVR